MGRERAARAGAPRSRRSEVTPASRRANSDLYFDHLTRCPHCSAENADDARFCGSCGRTMAATEPSTQATGPGPGAPAPDLIGREIGGRYRVLAKLGEGGMGAV